MVRASALALLLVAALAAASLLPAATAIQEVTCSPDGNVVQTVKMVIGEQVRVKAMNRVGSTSYTWFDMGKITGTTVVTAKNYSIPPPAKPPAISFPTIVYEYRGSGVGKSSVTWVQKRLWSPGQGLTITCKVTFDVTRPAQAVTCDSAGGSHAVTVKVGQKLTIQAVDNVGSTGYFWLDTDKISGSSIKLVSMATIPTTATGPMVGFPTIVNTYSASAVGISTVTWRHERKFPSEKFKCDVKVTVTKA